MIITSYVQTKTFFRKGGSIRCCLSSLKLALTYRDYSGNRSFWCFQTYESIPIPFSMSFDCKWRKWQAEGVPIMKISNLILTNVHRIEFTYSWKMKKKKKSSVLRGHICVGKITVTIMHHYTDQPSGAFHCTVSTVRLV